MSNNSNRKPNPVNVATVTYAGQTYTVPPADSWPVDVLEHIEEERLVSAAKALLGEKQWARFKASPKTLKNLGEFFEEAGKATGISGN